MSELQTVAAAALHAVVLWGPFLAAADALLRPWADTYINHNS